MSGGWSIAAGMVSAALAIGGCATIINGTTQEIEIVTDPAGATATILPQGSTVQTPAEVELERKQAHTIFVELEGYCRETVYIDRITSQAVKGNVFLGIFGGLFSLIAFKVDAANGAAYTFTPDALDITLRPIQSAEAASCAPAGPGT